jgi:hypothetical protein
MMSDTVSSASENESFPSLTSLRAAHNDLMKRYHEIGDTSDMTVEIERFIRRGAATGALLDLDRDRWAAQSQLDYWYTLIYHPGYEPPDATLADFDPLLAPELDGALCPYVGLDAFHENNSEVFYGRARLVSDLVKKLKTSRFLAVLGPSGSGKSSVVRAGLIPVLQQGALLSGAEWLYLAPIVPGSDPLANLARLVTSAIELDISVEDMIEQLAASPAYLAQTLAERVRRTFVLVIDQFEEAFTLCHEDRVRERFIDNLLGVTQQENAEHRVIVTMRTDFEANVARIPALQTAFEDGLIRVTPLTASELREAIEAPAAPIGLKFEEGVIDSLLHDTLGEPAALPLLQFTLLKLWDDRERNRITWDAYRRLGGGRLALARTADEFYNSLIPEEQVTVRRILLKMVRPGEGLEVTSNRVPRVALYQKAEANDRIDRVLEKLIAARLVRLSEGDTAADDQVEVAHEALVRNWPRFVEWLEEERVALRQRQRLTIAAEQWVRLDRNPAALWRGVLLEEARRYDDLDEMESEFIQAGHAAEQAEVKRQIEEARREKELEYTQMLAESEGRRAQDQIKSNRRLRLVAVGLLAALFLAATAAILAINKSEQAEHASRVITANSLLNDARVVYENDPLLGFRLALESLMIAPADELKTQSMISQTVYDMAANGRELMFGGEGTKFALSPDRSRIVVAYNDAPGMLRRTSDGTRVMTLTGIVSDGLSAGPFYKQPTVFFSPDKDGAYLFVSYRDVPSELRRTLDGSMVATLTGQINNLYFSPWPTSTYFLVDYQDKPGELRRSIDGSVVATLSERIGSVQFSDYGSNRGYFVVQYYSNTVPAELRRWADGSTVITFTHVINNLVFSSDKDASHFIVTYRSAPDELHHTGDGSTVLTFTNKIRDVLFSPGADASRFLVAYENAPVELRRVADGSLVTTLTDKLSSELPAYPPMQTYLPVPPYPPMPPYPLAPVWHFSGDPNASYFVVQYEKTPAELRRTADGSIVSTLSRVSGNILCDRYPCKNIMIVSYVVEPDHIQTDVRRIRDGSLVFTVTDMITGASSFLQANYSSYTPLTFIPNLEADDPYVIVTYNSSLGELRRVNDGSRLETLAGVVKGASYSSVESPSYFLINYQNKKAELRSVEDGRLVETLTDTINNLFGFGTSPAANFVIGYTDAPGELRNTDDGSLVTVLTDRVSGIFFLSVPTATHFIVNYANGTSELRNLKDGSYMAAFATSSYPLFSPSPTGTMLSIYHGDNLDTIYGELYNLRDGTLIISDTHFSIVQILDPEPGLTYLLGYIFDSQKASSQLYSQDSASLEDHSLFPIYFTFAPFNKRLMSLQDSRLHQVVDLKASDELVRLDLNGQKLLQKSGSRFYVLDLAFLRALGSKSGNLSLPELRQLVCQYLFTQDKFDESSVNSYLDNLGATPQACPKE